MTFDRKSLGIFFALVFAAALVLSSASIVPLQVHAQADVLVKLAEAENAVSEAFVAVHGAESFGANVTDLIVRLDAAGGVLAAANIAFRNGDHDGAGRLADDCIAKVGGIAGDAVSLKNAAESARIDGMNLSILAASVGLSVLFLASLIGWRYLRGFYLRRALRLRPGSVKEN